MSVPGAFLSVCVRGGEGKLTTSFSQLACEQDNEPSEVFPDVALEVRSRRLWLLRSLY